MTTNSDFVGRMYAAINARDRKAIRALSASDVVFASTVEVHKGPDALLEWMDDGDSAFDDFVVEPIAVEEVGGNAMASICQRGRGKASGAEVELPFIHVWTIRDGRAVRVQSFTDRDAAIRYAESGEGGIRTHEAV